MITVDGQESLAVIENVQVTDQGRRLLARLPYRELDFWTHYQALERRLQIEATLEPGTLISSGAENDKIEGLFTAALLPRDDEMSFQVELLEVDGPQRVVVRPDTEDSPVIS